MIGDLIMDVTRGLYFAQGFAFRRQYDDEYFSKLVREGERMMSRARTRIGRELIKEIMFTLDADANNSHKGSP